MATQNISYGSTVVMTVTNLQSLANSATVGWQSCLGGGVWSAEERGFGFATHLGAIPDQGAQSHQGAVATHAAGCRSSSAGWL